MKIVINRLVDVFTNPITNLLFGSLAYFILGIYLALTLTNMNWLAFTMLYLYIIGFRLVILIKSQGTNFILNKKIRNIGLISGLLLAFIIVIYFFIKFGFFYGFTALTILILKLASLSTSWSVSIYGLILETLIDGFLLGNLAYFSQVGYLNISNWYFFIPTILISLMNSILIARQRLQKKPAAIEEWHGKFLKAFYRLNPIFLIIAYAVAFYLGSPSWLSGLVFIFSLLLYIPLLIILNSEINREKVSNYIINLFSIFTILYLWIL